MRVSAMDRVVSLYQLIMKVLRLYWLAKQNFRLDSLGDQDQTHKQQKFVAPEYKN